MLAEALHQPMKTIFQILILICCFAHTTSLAQNSESSGPAHSKVTTKADIKNVTAEQLKASISQMKVTHYRNSKMA